MEWPSPIDNKNLTRIAHSLKFEQRKLLLNAFITSQFSYAPVVWMFHNRKLNNHINPIYERSLRILYQDHNSTFGELLAKDGSFKIHDRNFQKLLIETFKVKTNLASEIMNGIFRRAPSNFSEQGRFLGIGALR